MVNTYARLPDLKRAIQGQGSRTSNDAELMRLAGVASREVDRASGREFFWTPLATRYFNVDSYAGATLDLHSDLLVATEVKLDSGGTGLFATTFVENTDFYLEPELEASKRRITLFGYGAQYTGWPEGRRLVRVIGQWGYSKDVLAAGTIGTGGITSSATSLPLVAGHSVDAGDTIVVESEHMWVSAVTPTSATVQRAVNGTTAAAHIAAVAVSRRVFPDMVQQAVILRVAQMLRDQQTGMAGQVASPEMGGYFYTNFPLYRDLVRSFHPTGGIGVG